MNGERHNPGSKLGDVIKDAAIESNLALAPDVQYVEPFLTSREEALKPTDGNSVLSLFLLAAGVLAAYGAFRFWLKKRSLATPAA